VNGFFAATALSFAVIFVAELGDKSQLMALTFATRFKPWPVLIGITVATALVHLVAGSASGSVRRSAWSWPTCWRFWSAGCSAGTCRSGSSSTAAALFAIFGIWLVVEAVIELT
jgi:putative Ca2+/H+ antiporter (TMEM165/GDT1 family)